MSDAARPRFSGFFTRKKHDEGNGSSSKRPSSDVQIPIIGSTKTSLDLVDDEKPMLTLDGTLRPRLASENPESKSFFKIPKRKKASSLSRGDIPQNARSLSIVNNPDSPRLSSQTTRSIFEGLLRPTLSARTSVASIVQASPASAIVATSTSLAVQGSPRLELSSCVDQKVLSRQISSKSTRSMHTTHSTPTSELSPKQTSEVSSKLHGRGRSLTYAGSETQRKASSTVRSSKFFSMGRLRRDTDDNFLFRPLSREISPPSSPNKSEVEKVSPLTLPSRQGSESVHHFLTRLEMSMSKTLAASVLATSDDDFHHQCLQLYMQQFNFVNDPLDMALRKFLMDTHLPKETQQIDRVLNAFSERYQICNPRLYDTQVTPYVLSFALIMLHTDRFNQNNRNKMTKIQFIKNTRSEYTEHVSTDILEYFYDNIISTPFILVEDEYEPSIQERSGPPTPNEGSTFRNASSSALSVSQTSNNTAFGRRSLDLYPLIMEDKLDTLRPQISSILQHDNCLSYTGTLPVINVAKLHAAFTHPATLQLVSARSRPEAFVTDHSTQNPQDTDPGLVDIQITKIGILKRKEQKRAGSKPVYREWGVMLTPSQILFFKNIAWVKHYMHQIRDHDRDDSLILDPPVHNYSPDTYMPTSDTVAIFDSAASKKSSHFCFLGRGGEQTYLVASSEDEMNDWVAKINYAAAFHTIGVRIRGISGRSDQPGSPRKRIQRHASTSTLSTINGATASLAEVAIARQNALKGKIAEIEKILERKAEQLARLRQQGRNLCTLTPVLPRTRASVISAAGSLSAKISWARMELIKTQCHRDILFKDLELETNPSASVFTTPIRPHTPPAIGGTPRTSPSKGKLGLAVDSLMRQVSSDTMRIRASKHSKGKGQRNELLELDGTSHHKRSDSPTHELSHELVDGLVFSSESLDDLFKNGSEDSSSARPVRSSPTPSAVERSRSVERPCAARTPSLTLDVSSLEQRKNGAKPRLPEHHDPEGTSAISSRSSGQSSNKFILHGRKVSIQSTSLTLQSPSDLLGGGALHRESSNPNTSSALALSSSSSSSSSSHIPSELGNGSIESSEDLFVDAHEHPLSSSSA